MINVLDVKSLSSSHNSTFSTSKLFLLGSSNSHGQYFFFNDPSLGVKKTKSKDWKAKDLPDHWLEFAKHEQKWNTLSKRNKRTIQLFWPHRHCELSYEEIAKLLRVSRMQAIRIVQDMIKAGLIKKEFEFVERHGKQTKIHKRNYYVLTELGRKKLDELVHEFFSEENGKMLPRKDITKVRKDCQEKSASSFDRKVFEGTQEEYHKFLEERLAQLESEQEPINTPLAALFELHGFKSHFSSLCPRFRKQLNQTPLKRVVKILKLIEKKIKKGFRIRNFWAFFRYALQNKIKCWFTKRADEYKNAIDRKTKIEGFDSQSVVEQIIKLQDRTKQIATRDEIRGLLCFGAFHLNALLKVVNFKLNITPVKNWIGYVYFLSKKSVIDLAKIYKSHETLQKQDAELAKQKTWDDKTAWENYFSNCDEKPIFRPGPMREIWDCG